MIRLSVVNIGAAGTFVVGKSLPQAKLRREFLRRLPFETEATICSAEEILELAASESFAEEPSGPDIVRFVSILSKRPRMLPVLPLHLPAGKDWLVRLIAIRGRFALGLYRRTMRTIGCLNQMEKHLGCSVTTRNWNTFSNLFEILTTNNKHRSTRSPQVQMTEKLAHRRDLRASAGGPARP